jgi:undecaprenyl-diphosphatase
MQQKLSRKAAAEFSFFLAVPTLAGAFVKSMWDAHQDTPELFNSQNITLLLIGNLIAFIVAIIAIKGFIGILTKYGFKAFGYYRIVIGILIIGFILLGYDLKIA